jgi:hypothetical protein
MNKFQNRNLKVQMYEYINVVRMSLNFNTVQNHWVSGLCPSSRMLNTIRHNSSGTDPVSKMLVFSSYLEFWTIDKDQKSSDSECHTPLSEPFRVYFNTIIVLFG